jgi:hypothetical protein
VYVNKTWGEIVHEALDQVQKEIDFIYTSPDCESWSAETKESAIDDLRYTEDELEKYISLVT